MDGFSQNRMKRPYKRKAKQSTTELPVVNKNYEILKERFKRIDKDFIIPEKITNHLGSDFDLKLLLDNKVLLNIQKMHVVNVLNYFLQNLNDDKSNQIRQKVDSNDKRKQTLGKKQSEKKKKVFKKNVVLEMSDPGFGKTFTSLFVGKCLRSFGLIERIVVFPFNNSQHIEAWLFAINQLGMRDIVSLIKPKNIDYRHTDKIATERTNDCQEVEKHLFIFDEFHTSDSTEINEDDGPKNSSGTGKKSVIGQKSVIGHNDTKFIILITTCLKSYEKMNSIMLNSKVMNWPRDSEKIAVARTMFYDGLKFHLGNQLKDSSDGSLTFLQGDILDKKTIDNANSLIKDNSYDDKPKKDQATLTRKKLMNLIFSQLPFVKKTEFSFVQSRICSIVAEINNPTFKEKSNDFLHLYVNHLNGFGLNSTIIPYLDQLHQMYETLMIPSMCILASQHVQEPAYDDVLQLLRTIKETKKNNVEKVITVFKKKFKDKCSSIIHLSQVKKILHQCDNEDIRKILEKNDSYELDFSSEFSQASSSPPSSSSPTPLNIDFDVLQNEIEHIENLTSKTVICVSDSNYEKLKSFMNQMEIEHKDFNINDPHSNVIRILKIGNVKREHNYSGNKTEWHVFACPFTDPGENEILFSRFARINNASTSHCHIVVSSQKHFVFMYRFWQNSNSLSLRNIRRMNSEVEIISKKSKKIPLMLYDKCFNLGPMRTFLKEFKSSLLNSDIEKYVEETFNSILNAVRASSGLFLSELTCDEKEKTSFSRLEMKDGWKSDFDIFLSNLTYPMPENATGFQLLFYNSDSTTTTVTGSISNREVVQSSLEIFTTPETELNLNQHTLNSSVEIPAIERTSSNQIVNSSFVPTEMDSGVSDFSEIMEPTTDLTNSSSGEKKRRRKGG